jgi:hypothetical protein
MVSFKNKTTFTFKQMQKMKPYLSLLLLFTCVISMNSCSNPGETATDVSGTDSSYQPALPTGIEGASQPPVQTVEPSSALPQAVTQQSAPGNSKLNPPHGQPGHRCDIAVGAPLDMAPPASPSNANSMTPVVNPVQSPSPVQQSSPTPQQPGMSTGKLNPPHGQPGHRCDLSVGAPLDGAPPAPDTKPADTSVIRIP